MWMKKYRRKYNIALNWGNCWTPNKIDGNLSRPQGGLNYILSDPPFVRVCGFCLLWFELKLQCSISQKFKSWKDCFCIFMWPSIDSIVKCVHHNLKPFNVLSALKRYKVLKYLPFLCCINPQITFIDTHNWNKSHFLM